MDSLTRFRLTMASIEALKAALITESEKRAGRSFEQWATAEAQAVWKAARGFAQQHGLRQPLLDDVIRVERQASGHSDYGSKWALYVTELMMPATC